MHDGTHTEIMLSKIREKLEKYRYTNSNNKKKEEETYDILKNFEKMTLTPPISKTIKEHEFQVSTSVFNRNDMEILSIVIKEVHEIEEFFSYSHIPVKIKKETLYEISKRIGEYECRRFDLELKRVNDNNKLYFSAQYNKEESGYFEIPNEAYIDSLADTIFRISNIYDGKKFESLKPKNSLYICNKRYGSSVDKELRLLNSRMVFMIEESKHITTTSYLKGDLQLACNLIVSLQQNRYISKNRLFIPLPTVFAIKILATSFFVYLVNYDEEYLDYIKEGNKKKDIIVYKLSYCKDSINILYETQMELLFNILSSIGEAVLLNSSCL